MTIILYIDVFYLHISLEAMADYLCVGPAVSETETTKSAV